MPQRRAGGGGVFEQKAKALIQARGGVTLTSAAEEMVIVLQNVDAAGIGADSFLL